VLYTRRSIPRTVSRCRKSVNSSMSPHQPLFSTPQKYSLFDSTDADRRQALLEGLSTKATIAMRLFSVCKDRFGSTHAHVGGKGFVRALSSLTFSRCAKKDAFSSLFMLCKSSSQSSVCRNKWPSHRLMQCQQSLDYYLSLVEFTQASAFVAFDQLDPNNFQHLLSYCDQNADKLHSLYP
jgi:hypothetical protein